LQNNELEKLEVSFTNALNSMTDEEFSQYAPKQGNDEDNYMFTYSPQEFKYVCRLLGLAEDLDEADKFVTAICRHKSGNQNPTTKHKESLVIDLCGDMYTAAACGSRDSDDPERDSYNSFLTSAIETIKRERLWA
jgi:hypothetical protein